MKKNHYLTPFQLKAEIERCLNCKTKPCMKACPVHCCPAEFIAYAKKGDIEQAAQTIVEKNPMGQTCGLICPDMFCMKACTRGAIDTPINIPKVQATLLEHARQRGIRVCPLHRKKQLSVAVIGAGPAGLSAAFFLAKNGFHVTLFETASTIGGALNLIPQNRLPFDAVRKDWDFIQSMGNITLKTQTFIENPIDLLAQGFKGIIVATGEPHGAALEIPGENDVIPYQSYLKTPDQFMTKGRVAVIGGGNVAADCALTAYHQGAAHIEMFVRRGLKQMRMSRSEQLTLIETGIDISTFTRPVKVEREEETQTLTLWTEKTFLNEENQVMAYPETLIARKGFNLIIKAIGARALPKIQHPALIYAGDALTGGSTIVQAVSSGLAAAETLQQQILNKE